MNSIKVVNSKKRELAKLGYSSLEDFLSKSDKHLYVGRDMTFFVPGANKSKWHNPFKSKNFNNDIEKTLELFKDHIRNSPLYDQLHELDGKTLACWCFPAPCHATALKELYQEKYLQNP